MGSQKVRYDWVTEHAHTHTHTHTHTHRDTHIKGRVRPICLSEASLLKASAIWGQKLLPKNRNDPACHPSLWPCGWTCRLQSVSFQGASLGQRVHTGSPGTGHRLPPATRPSGPWSSLRPVTDGGAKRARLTARQRREEAGRAQCHKNAT